jgi:hypothetical protein
MATDLLNTGMWDQGRLKFILECVEQNKSIYKTDKIYLESMTQQLEDKIHKLKQSTVKITKPKENTLKTLISNKTLDDIIDKKNLKTVDVPIPARKKKSFLTRLFFR